MLHASVKRVSERSELTPCIIYIYIMKVLCLPSVVQHGLVHIHTATHKPISAFNCSYHEIGKLNFKNKTSIMMVAKLIVDELLQRADTDSPVL